MKHLLKTLLNLSLSLATYPSFLNWLLLSLCLWNHPSGLLNLSSPTHLFVYNLGESPKAMFFFFFLSRNNQHDDFYVSGTNRISSGYTVQWSTCIQHLTLSTHILIDGLAWFSSYLADHYSWRFLRARKSVIRCPTRFCLGPLMFSLTAFHSYTDDAQLHISVWPVLIWFEMWLSKCLKNTLFSLL